ncbi:MAG: hypothetical protein ACI9TH_003562 [Kiritimatiellia bacterium]|jgi:hypothetical protein
MQGAYRSEMEERKPRLASCKAHPVKIVCLSVHGGLRFDNLPNMTIMTGVTKPWLGLAFALHFSRAVIGKYQMQSL